MNIKRKFDRIATTGGCPRIAQAAILRRNNILITDQNTAIALNAEKQVVNVFEPQAAQT